MLTDNIQKRPKKVLSVFTLVMINMIAVDSIRALPISAEYGLSLVFYYVLGAILFMIPSALAAAEMSTGWPKAGGVYIWVREAFGLKLGFLAAWLLWIYNIVWYPTILSLLASTFFYIFGPSFGSAYAHNKEVIFFIVVIMYFLATLVNCFGMGSSGKISNFCSIVGTIFPITLIIVLGFVWLKDGRALSIDVNLVNIVPKIHNINQLSILTGMLFGLVGMEMTAIHAQDVKNPSKDYPKALLISTIFILVTSILGSLAIAIVIPRETLHLSSAVIDSFGVFFKAYNMSGMIPVIAICIIIGGFGGVSAWIIGPSKCMLIACEDGSFPKMFSKVNNKGVPINLLILQGLVFLCMSFLFLFFPGFNSAYWLLTAITGELSCLFYILLFAALIKLKFSRPETARPYQIPFGKTGVILVGGVGILTCLFVFTVGLFSPSHISMSSSVVYEFILISGIVLICIFPFMIKLFVKLSRRN